MDEPHNERKPDSGWRASEKRLEDIPPPSGFQRLREQLSLFLGPIPAGIIVLMVPLVLVWYALDLLEYWQLKALLIAVTAVFWSYHREAQRERGDS
ncbi:hypothetical protein AWV79_35675 [Cupriavidus sp. UYMMa02A]|nr:hypothetical protein AWV79_35675 [Cupriavidus sp. UYMMa02A]